MDETLHLGAACRIERQLGPAHVDIEEVPHRRGVDHGSRVEHRRVPDPTKEGVEVSRIPHVADHRLDLGREDLEQGRVAGDRQERTHLPPLRDQRAHEVLPEPSRRAGDDREAVGTLAIGQLHASPRSSETRGSYARPTMPTRTGAQGDARHHRPGPDP